MNTRGLTFLSCFFLLAACGGGSSGTDAGQDLGAAVDDGGLPPAAVQAIDDLTFGLAVATALGAPLAPDGATLMGDPLGTPDTTTHMRAEHGFSGSSVVTPATCVMYGWTGLTASVTMTGCTLEATGMPVSGTLSLGVALRPSTFTVTFTGLTVGTSTFDGHVTLTMHGTDTMAAPPTLDVDLTYTTASGSTHLTATGLTVVTTPTSVAITGAATVTTGGATTAITTNALTWAMGQCLPSMGTAVVTLPGLPTSTLTFLPTTPMDGKVTVVVPPFPAVTKMLFMACP